jgi:hypothetical protein
MIGGMSEVIPGIAGKAGRGPSVAVNADFVRPGWSVAQGTFQTAFGVYNRTPSLTFSRVSSS